MTTLRIAAIALMTLVSSSAWAQTEQDSTSVLKRGRVGAYLGARVGGSGELEATTEAFGQSASSKDGYDDVTGIGVSAYYVHTMNPTLAFGPRVGWIPEVAVEGDSDTRDLEVGSQLDVRGRGEVSFPIPLPNTRVHLIGEVGPYVIFPGDDLEDYADAVGAEARPSLGLGAGLGAGLSWRLIPALTLRAEILGEYQGIRLINESDNELSMTGSRVWLMVGAAF